MDPHEILALFARYQHDCRNDAVLRQVARGAGAIAWCDRRRCRRALRCRGPWEPSLWDDSVALPSCLMLRVDADLDNLSRLADRLRDLAGTMEDARESTNEPPGGRDLSPTVTPKPVPDASLPSPASTPICPPHPTRGASLMT
jgi:hypothetical protein